MEFDMLTLHKKNHSSSSSKKKSAFLGVFPPIIVKYYFKIFVRNSTADACDWALYKISYSAAPSTNPTKLYTSKHADAVQFELIDDHLLNTESLWLRSALCTAWYFLLIIVGMKIVDGRKKYYCWMAGGKMTFWL